MLAAVLDDVQAFALAWVQRLVPLQYLRVAQDTVERRAQLVAHVGQEGALGLIGSLGHPPRSAFRLSLLAFGQVEHKGDAVFLRAFQ